MELTQICLWGNSTDLSLLINVSLTSFLHFLHLALLVGLCERMTPRSRSGDMTGARLRPPRSCCSYRIDGIERAGADAADTAFICGFDLSAFAFVNMTSFAFPNASH